MPVRTYAKENERLESELRRVFFAEVFAGRGTPTAVAKLYVQIWGKGTVKGLAEQFSGYLVGTTESPRSESLWKLAAALRVFGHSWCAGPVVLYACSKFRDFVCSLYSWQFDSGLDLSHLIHVLPETVAMRSDSLQYRARQMWTLSESRTRQLQEAWHHQHVCDSRLDKALALCLPLADSCEVSLPQKRFLLVEYLERWAGLAYARLRHGDVLNASSDGTRQLEPRDWCEPVDNATDLLWYQLIAPRNGASASELLS